LSIILETFSLTIESPVRVFYHTFFMMKEIYNQECERTMSKVYFIKQREMPIVAAEFLENKKC